MKKILLFLLGMGFLLPGRSQDKPAYVLYTAKGKKVRYAKMIKVLREKDIVLFGELHNNPIAHWLELELAKDFFGRRPLALGAEMLERDNQEALEEYLQGKIDGPAFASKARLWNNFSTDYAPLVTFAREQRLSFAATNIPRRYAALVARGGFEALDTLPAAEKAWIAPLPIAYDPELPGYKNMLQMMPGHGGANFPKAQAIKDATMAHFILHHYKSGSLFLHYSGAYHIENYEGILWYLKKSRPDLKYATITTVSQKDPGKLLPENRRKADFIICVDEDMTTTF
ncbi:ChaN family lipoprotein [Paraflavisolibacter sp. H34]|uniref:ChaN family lipoprotein n=1 Tax=Huijunlia imazamoxiresistens TaxID=3127457 RepID=UPI003015B227